VGEIKNVRRSIPIALFLSLLFGVVYWTITSTLTLNAVGANWMYAVGYAWDNGLSSYTLPFPPSQPLILAVAAYPNVGLIYAMFFTYIVGSLAPLFAYFWIPSKYFFAWSFDRVIPSKFADINERFHTPYLSIIAIMVLGILLSVVYLFFGWSTSFTFGTVLWGVSYVVPGLALAAFPFVKKDVFALAPGFVRAKVGSIPVMSVVGIITAISFAGAGYIAYITPAAAVPTLFGLYVTVGIIALGFIVYFASWAYHKSRGIDISKVLRSIPPE
jgi:amino acid transporter